MIFSQHIGFTSWSASSLIYTIYTISTSCGCFHISVLSFLSFQVQMAPVSVITPAQSGAGFHSGTLSSVPAGVLVGVSAEESRVQVHPQVSDVNPDVA